MGLRINKYPKVKIDLNIPNYGDHPYFVKKTEEAKAFMEKVGLPSDLLKVEANRTRKQS